MIGAIIGDIVGSRFEFHNTDTKDFEFFDRECTFTDDTVMTLAVAETIMRCFSKENSYDRLGEYAVHVFHEVGRMHPYCGYGGRFFRWMLGDVWVPYNSFGNGSAMRISPVGDVAKSIKQAKRMSYDLTAVTHNHAEGLKGAEAAVVAKKMLKMGKSRDEVIDFIGRKYYKIDKTVDEWRLENKGEHGREVCQVTVPQAFVCFKDGTDVEDVIRNAVSIGGDSDTIAAIAGGIAEACYEVPEKMKDTAMLYLTRDLRKICDRWDQFCVGVK